MVKSYVNQNPTEKISSHKKDNVISIFQKKTNLTIQKDILGKGGYSIVYHAKSKGGRSFAVKLTQLPTDDQETCEKDYEKKKFYAEQDCFYSSILQHKNIIKTFKSIKLNETSYAMIMQKASSSLTNLISLFYKNKITNHLVESNCDAFYWGNYMGQNLVFYYFNQMLSAVQFLHQSGICHFDIKPDNFLLFGNEIKLTDFNLSKEINSNAGEKTFNLERAGTFSYIPPEFYITKHQVIKADVGKVDIFALGCILFKMIYNKYIIYREDGKVKYSIVDIFNQIKEGFNYMAFQLQFNAKRGYSKEAINMVGQMLMPDIRKRIKLYDLMDMTERVMDKKEIKKVENINGEDQIKTIIELQKSSYIKSKRTKRAKFRSILYN